MIRKRKQNDQRKLKIKFKTVLKRSIVKKTIPNKTPDCQSMMLHIYKANGERGESKIQHTHYRGLGDRGRIQHRLHRHERNVNN